MKFQIERPHWYVVYAKPQKEAIAQFHLDCKGLATFFPRPLLLPSPQRSCRLVPLFPNYLFVQLQRQDEYEYVRWSPGVKRLLTCNGLPTPVEEGVILLLKQRANTDGVIEVHARPALSIGCAVRITEGPFAGLMGIIENPPDAKGRVRVLFALLGRQVGAAVPVGIVERR